MPYKFNVFTGNLDLVTSNTGYVKGPPSSTDKAITVWSGTTGDQVQDSKTVVQDSGAIEAQAFITRRSVTDAVVVHSGESWIAPSLTIEVTGSIIIEADAEVKID